jgi:hypothetical protein
VGVQEFFFENPVTPGILGLLAVGIAAFVWTQTGHKAALYTILALAALTLVAVIINLQVVTDRERIRQIMNEVAAALRNNDSDTALSYIHPNAAGPLQRAKREFSRIKFEEARITGVKEIAVNPLTKPPTAIAEIYARVKATVGSYKGSTVRFVRVYFMQRDGRWLVQDYQHYEPTAGFRDTPLTQPAF